MKRLSRNCRTIWMVIYLAWVATGLLIGPAWASPKDPTATLLGRLAPLLGHRDAVAVVGPDGRTILSINADQLLVPASILKTLTALAALHYLGADYRFPTDFFLSTDNRLIIKGYGDPLLVSERIAGIARHLSERISHIDGLVLDDGHFSYPIAIPGRGSSTQPYDAPVGALCVNFNTVNFKSRDGRWVSAEPQTPLLPFALAKIEASGMKQGRITLADDRREILRYSGEMFAHFLAQAGITMGPGGIDDGTADGSDRLVWRHYSPIPLQEVVAALLEFSNNFIANQLMLAMGAAVVDPPGTVEKGLMVLQNFYASELGIQTGRIVEASGLSRDNRISANAMLHILDRFQPYHRLMRQQGRQWYKTGTLNGINTRAGYLRCENGGFYRFVVMINTPGKRIDGVMRTIEQRLR